LNTEFWYLHNLVGNAIAKRRLRRIGFLLKAIARLVDLEFGLNQRRLLTTKTTAATSATRLALQCHAG
jgi:hypothetical protein